MAKIKNILVISNNCFSESDSNGRTLGNLFWGWPKEHLAQMCVISRDPNWKLCNNYYCIEDKTVLKAFIHFGKAKGRCLTETTKDAKQVETNVNTVRANVGKKTLGKVVLRELVWAWKRWNSKSFQIWVEDFNPDLVVLQFGDSVFMLDLAYYIATKRNIPLVIYNTEGYYFFPRNWYHISKLDTLLFPIYKKIYRNKVNRIMSVAKHCVYLNDKLKEEYDRAFGNTSTVIYNSSSIERSSEPSFAKPRFCYLGNLGLDRDSGIVEIGEVLQSINPDYNIEVYGSADDVMKQKFANSSGVDYKGLVSYDEVKKIISESDVLFHIETEKGYKERQLQYAFSTKIADSIASGKCFVLYGPQEVACSKYIMETEAGWYASNKGQLKDVIEEIISNPQRRTEVLAVAKKTAEENHNFLNNANKFQSILRNL